MTTAGDFHHTWHELPLGGLNDIIGTGTCLILAPHPDDESLGCGGLIAEATDLGLAVRLIFVSDGTGSHCNSLLFPKLRLRRERELEANRAGMMPTIFTGLN